MDAEADRWRRVKDLFAEAVERPAADRARWLAAACSGDDALRRQVESLLASGGEASEFFRKPIPPAARLGPGSRIAGYEVVERIGAGGMGEVYRARDVRLNRSVALKILPVLFARDPDRLNRFVREAQLLAALNHPNIAAIYGLEESDHAPTLILELVEGPTLADRIGRGPIPLDEAVAIARQIADALEAAHEQGIVHRDLKPANVKLRADGTVKVLDFGLAKMLERPLAPSADATASPTVVSPAATASGVLLGTAAYMSPEQARGHLVDRRADIWAFGCVLFEMLTGQRAFGGETVTDTLAAVMRDTPPLDKLPPATPARIRLLIARCLERDPKRRLRDIGDARLELESRSEIDAAVVEKRDAPAGWRRSAAIAVAGLAVGALIAAAIAAGIRRSEAPRSQAVVRFTIVPAVGQALEVSGFRNNLALSPDGRYLVYPGAAGLFVRALDQSSPQLLPGTVGAGAPFFSPDGRWVGFFQGTDLKKIALASGSIATVARAATAINGTWGDDDAIVFDADQGGMSRVAASGGQPEVLTSDSSQCLGDPWMLPGGGALLCNSLTADHPGNPQISVLDVKTREVKPLLRGGRDARYLNTGHLLYRSAGTLFAAPFDLARREVTGEAVRVVDVGDSYAVSTTGTLAKLTADTRRPLVWVDRKGGETPTAAPARPYFSFRLSPDGTRAALIEYDDMNVSIWDFARDTLTRLVVGAPVFWVPVWTADGRRIVYTANRTGAFNLYTRDADGSGAEQRLTTSTQHQVPNSMLPDGSFLLAAQLHPKTAWDIVKLPLSGTSTATEVLVSTPASEFAANISPNGRFFAYQSAETGRFEILVRPYPEAGRRQWQISSGGGFAPVWAHNGRELFYLDGDSHTLMSVDVDTSGADLKVGKPKPLLHRSYFGTFYPYDVSLDGQRFLFIKEPPATNTIEVIVNWAEELRARLTAKQ